MSRVEGNTRGRELGVPCDYRLRSLLAATVAVGLGCETPQPADPTPARSATAAVSTSDGHARENPRPPPFPHESDTEYQNGLAHLMFTAPMLGPSAVTSAFRVGYLVGLQEGSDYESFLDGKFGEVGCLKGYAVARDNLSTATEGDAAAINSTCTNRIPTAQSQGPLFSKWRLKEAEWAGQHLSDPQEIDTLITIYVVGYNMGFAHQWEIVDHEVHVEQVVKGRCSQVVQTIQPPLPPERSTAAIAICEDAGHALRAQFGKGLRCFLANKEMNGEL